MLKESIRRKLTRLTDADVEFMMGMEAEERAAFMETVLTDAVSKKFDEIRKESGELAAEKFLDDTLLDGINQYRSELAAEPERERVREKVREDVSHKRQAENVSSQNRNESPDEELLRLTIKKIMDSKMGGKELTYGEALKLTQEENPGLATAIKAQMDNLRENPPHPWER